MRGQRRSTQPKAPTTSDVERALTTDTVALALEYDTTAIASPQCCCRRLDGEHLASPPDTIDALLLVSPTPFSVYGVTAMWGVVATAILVLLRRRLGLRHSL